MASEAGQRAIADPALGADCVLHARMFFNRPDYDLASAAPPTFTLVPEGAMYDDLRRDYAAMTGMVFGPPPSFDAVVENVAELETAINGSNSVASG